MIYLQIFLIATIVLPLSGLSIVGADPVVTSGSTTFVTGAFGKYRFLQTQNTWAGTWPSVNQSAVTITWVNPGETNVSFTYDPTGDKLTNTARGTTVTYPNVSQRTNANPATWNVMTVRVRDSTAGTTLQFNNVTLGAYYLGSFQASTFPSDLTWTITNYTFGSGFTLSGTIYMNGTFTGGSESNKIEIFVGTALIVDCSQILVDDNRVNVGGSTQLRYNLKWNVNSSAVQSGTLSVNGTPHAISLGWSNFTVTDSSVANNTYIVTAVNASGVTNYTQSISNAWTVFDKLNITYSCNGTSLVAGDTASIGVTSTFLYDGAPVTSWSVDAVRNGTYYAVNNFTDYENTEVVYEYKAGNVTVENTYGVTAFQTNTITIAWSAPTLDHFSLSAVGSPQTAGSSFMLTITAKDKYGNTLTSYEGPNSLTDTTGTMKPISTGPFTNGVWSGNVTIRHAQKNVTITTSGGGKSETSNPFDVEPGPLDHFTLEFFPKKHREFAFCGVPFTVIITAKDSCGNTVTSYDGTNSLNDSAGTIDPKSTKPFVDGFWMGNVTIFQVQRRSQITTSGENRFGTSSHFNVKSKFVWPTRRHRVASCCS